MNATMGRRLCMNDSRNLIFKTADSISTTDTTDATTHNSYTKVGSSTDKAHEMDVDQDITSPESSVN